MELYVYNQSLEFKGVLDDFFSLRWRRKYATCGEFELHCSVTADTLKLLKSGFVISKRCSVECGTIEDIRIEDNEETGESITAKGRFLSSILDRRITGETVIIKDTAQTVMRNYVTESCISPTDLDRVIPMLQLGEVIPDTEQVEIQATYKNVLITCEKLARKSAQGFRVRGNFQTKQLYFEVYKGTDRSIEQSVRPHVIFSDEYDNTKNTAYSFHDVGYKTHCIVGGTDETQSKVLVNVGGGTGFNRRELYIDASETKTEETVLADYQLILRQNGDDALKVAQVIESFETEVDGIEQYKTAWDLGDIVSCIKKSWGLIRSERITEVEEIYENGIMQVIPLLGNPKPELIDLLKED